MKTTSTGIKRPSAYITKQKQRIKQHNGKVYLKNGDEFELELFNPTNLNQLAKIKMNGNYIEGGGIVLKPGERVFLERYLDSNNKFIFNTYEVGTSKEVKEAIKFNGDVEIEFYEESIPIPQILLNDSDWTQTPPFNQYPYNPYPYSGGIVYGSTTGNNVNYSTTSIGGTLGSTSFKSNSTSGGEVTMDSLSSNKQETGQVGKGSNSEQKFVEVNMDFNSFSSTNVHWKILPKSQQIYTRNTIKRVYCTECGSRIRKSSFKFCPHCGTKVQ